MSLYVHLASIITIHDIFRTSYQGKLPKIQKKHGQGDLSKDLLLGKGDSISNHQKKIQTHGVCKNQKLIICN